MSIDSVTILFKKNKITFCKLYVSKLVLQQKHSKEIEVEMEEIGFYPYPGEDNYDDGGHVQAKQLNLVERSI